MILTCRLGITFALASSIATTLAAPLTAQTRDHLDRAVTAWSKVNTVRATFEQSIVNALTGNTLTATGVYQQQRPGKLAVTFDNPATDRIVADGKYVWLYLPSSAPGQVIRSALGSGGTGTVDLTAQFLTAPRKRYTVTAAGTRVVSGRATHGYVLVPRTPRDAMFTTATVFIDDRDATVRQFEVTDKSGLQRKVRLTSYRTNVPVDASAFVFTPPKGTRVVEQ